ncbi:site-specific DNA-cytosine methylase [Mycolicibacterium sp. BK556]|uniref:DNA cytosine methyltransferase n=1 Tax=unclassified Mycolicibacterium TaxID=2636767 RepID=UPI001616F64C|nr:MULTISPECIES: DNA (cytosine-5-)-methyltransferase [unclassified Mycolicibacterium]MBB3602758.1 site-specific DNA-cytosine methylase [Mycolicibacterium sp. BK556]MBB3632952.1 site-specific DNA-cytosine methylase [Mycolicibacterium sp. BK607]
MATTESNQVSLAELSPATGPRSRQQLNRLGHRALSVPPSHGDGTPPPITPRDRLRMVDLFAGIGGGFADGRGLHFFEIARILRAKRPAAFFLENVKGLLRHDGGRTFDVIRTVLRNDLGYSLHTNVIRACDFGVPQLRPRLLMVGFRDPSTPFEFPEPVALRTTLGDVLGGVCERTVSRTLLASGHEKPYGRSFNWAHYLVNGQVHRLTPAEALALQGFPPDFRLPASYTAAMRLVGNSVAVPAVAATARQIALSLGFTTTTIVPDDAPEAA